MNALKNIFIPHKKNKYKPHAISHAGLIVFAALILGLQAGVNLSSAGEFKVLGYATNVSSGELLSLTNSNRSGSGLAGLTLNSQLNQAAQAKANHMIANNYWAHVAPDGTTPWFFFGQAGYSYTRAGENLAYGYATSSGVVTGWMNSPAHAANILDSGFTEVGFGIANGASFQGGENTVVVALYASPYAAPIPEPEPQPVAEPEPVAEPQVAFTEPEPVSQQPIEEEPEEEVVEEPATEEEVEELNPQRYLARLAEDGTIVISGSPTPSQPIDDTTTNIEALVSGQAHWSLYVIMGSMSALAGIYFIRHMHAIHQLVRDGEHYVEGHPLLEASIVYLALWVMLFTSFGAIL